MPIILNREQVRQVDRLAIEQYKIPGLILMENAGRSAATAIDRVYGPSARAFILCGTGNNGGDGCVIARHLHNLGWSTRVLVAGDESKMSADMRANLQIIRAMGSNRYSRVGDRSEPPTSVGADVPTLQRRNIESTDTIVTADPGEQLRAISAIDPIDVVIDALLGTGFHGRLRPDAAAVIDAINAAPKRATVAVDVPSGLDCDTGEPGGTAIRANLTVTFVAAKPGFATASGARYVGRVEVADIGAPRELVERVAASM